MSLYINKGNDSFRNVREGEYVDKSGMISVLNATLNTERRYSCLTRCRRFGKSMAAEMLRAYYDESCDSRELFAGLEIARDPSFGKHLNKYPVIYLDITNFTTKYPHDHHISDYIQRDIKADVLASYPDISSEPDDDLMDVLTKVVLHTRKKFIVIIDEWDAICREFVPDTDGMDAYVNLLRRLFKGGDSKDVFAGAYLTGILPIKKYKTESALNNFREYSMTSPGKLASFFGFTVGEVDALCLKYGADKELMKYWYDGYQIGNEASVYNPYSVMEALANEEYTTYWSNTGAFDSLKSYIQMNFEGLKDYIIRMLAGDRCRVNTTSFSNDMSIVNNRDDVLTALIHLGYLSYDKDCQECYIPNREVAQEMENAVKANNWKHVVEALEDSRNLLKATLRQDAEAVSRGLEVAHDENTSILSYNDENSLACVLSIAYYYAKNDYVIHREYATGKGFADMVLIPIKNVDSPALLIELKYAKTADTAIDQIKRKNYPAKLAEYAGDILLVAISYDRDTKTHSCKIGMVSSSCHS